MTIIKETKVQRSTLEFNVDRDPQDPGKEYVKPAVISHSGEDILDELAPAQACYPFSSCGMTP